MATLTVRRVGPRIPTSRKIVPSKIQRERARRSVSITLIANLDALTEALEGVIATMNAMTEVSASAVTELAEPRYCSCGYADVGEHTWVKRELAQIDPDCPFHGSEVSPCGCQRGTVLCPH